MQVNSNEPGQPPLQAKIFLEDVLYDTVAIPLKKDSILSGVFPNSKDWTHPSFRNKTEVQGKIRIAIEEVTSPIQIDRNTRKDRYFVALVTATSLLLPVGLLIFNSHPPENAIAVPPSDRIVNLISKSAKPEPQSTPQSGVGKGTSGEHQGAESKSGNQGSKTQQQEKRLGGLLSQLTSLTSVGSIGNGEPLRENSRNLALSTEGLKKVQLPSGSPGNQIMGQGSGKFSTEGDMHLTSSDSSHVTKVENSGSTAQAPLGGLRHSVIESYINHRKERIRFCYEKELNSNPNLAGSLTVHFTIGKDGSVTQAQSAKDTLRNKNVVDCILTEVKSWSFPHPEGGTLVNVDFPFIFEPKTS